MKPITYRALVGTDAVPVYLTAYPTNTPGLLVGATYLPCGDDQEWNVVHARSGTAFPFCWDSPEGCLAYANSIAEFGDWQQDAEATRRFVRRIKGRLTGRAHDLGGRSHRTGYTPRGTAPLDNGVIA